MPLTKWQPPTPRHSVADDGRVTWLELFFDLIYVAALIQLGDRLAGDVSWSGVGSFAGAFVVLWWTWTGTTAFTNRFAVDDITHRLLAFAQMFAVGNLALLAATTPEHWRSWFVVAYIAARLPLIAMYLRAGRTTPDAAPIVRLYVSMFGASIGLWVLSLAVPGNGRFVVWGLAMLVEFAAPAIAVRRPSTTPSHDEHFQERYALFTIIVLGETFVKTLSEIADAGISVEKQLLGGLGFLALVAVWWTYFDDVADAHIRSTSPLSRSRATNRLLWVYSHLPLTAAITAFGVSAKKIVGVESLTDPFTTSYMWLLVGALSVVLLSVAVLDLLTASPHYAVNAPERVGPRLIAAAALGGVGLIAANTSIDAVITIALVAAIAVVQIAVEVVFAHRSEYRINTQVSRDIEAGAGTCSHLEGPPPAPRPSDGGCEACEEAGVEPVQLRWCLVCGHVGCCDDTPGRHAREHHVETGHPTIGSLERDADWAYCYLHEVSAPGHLPTS